MKKASDILSKGSLLENEDWEQVLKVSTRGVVRLHFCHTHTFDTGPAIYSEATGFVVMVDAEKSFILTCRHVVSAGPFIGYAVFNNHETCEVVPVYRNPVHDFGFLKFDIKSIIHMSVSALQLRPDLAKVGLQIRVIGNDAGQKLSFLSGEISRLDCNAPQYVKGYTDFNTNYIQASAAASGGSSGSPMINRDGFAIAMQAGATVGAATDFFLPLDRPKRVLDLLQRGEHILRGTIQTQWILEPFDECKRLGLSGDWEEAVRKQFPEETSMLVAYVVLPKGPASGKVEIGDILIRVNDQFITQFMSLESILDDHVGRTISVTVERNGKIMDVKIGVEDLHQITPDKFLLLAGGSYHDLSYQEARRHALSLENAGVYVCQATGSFQPEKGSSSGWLIQEVNNQLTPNLSMFIKVIQAIPDRKRNVIRYGRIGEPNCDRILITSFEHGYGVSKIVTRNDASGMWDFTPIVYPIPVMQQKSQSAKVVNTSSNLSNRSNIMRSVVSVHVSQEIKGRGLVVSAEKGVVVAAITTVPYDGCKVFLVFDDNMYIDAKICFKHPQHGFTFLQYDPSSVDPSIKTPKFATKYVQKGDETNFLGFNMSSRSVKAKTVVTDITVSAIPSDINGARYRAINFDAISIDSTLAQQCPFGVLMQDDETVHALWLSYHGRQDYLGFAILNLLPILREIISGNMPKLRMPDVEFLPISISEASDMGASQERITDFQKAEDEPQVLMVSKIYAGHDGGMQNGDILLTLHNKLVTRARDIDVMYTTEFVKAVIVRKQKEKVIELRTVGTEDVETARIVKFCGATLHKPHQAVRELVSKLHSEVYMSTFSTGSIAEMFGLTAQVFITKINGIPTPDVESFLSEEKKIGDKEDFSLEVICVDGFAEVLTLTKFEKYFPTTEYAKYAQGWVE
ncbi:hypothetical protein HBI23_254950 [Parastagonospora nodorum]|nr:hypothetical protein HBI23_254950 [Parastagonospora nodorum]KAH5622256.1 hypothetical protein HBI51_247980 [Parastagonospora nodorum]KAH6134158.1 hypothetical protein HBI68_250560 [Parastagonospora nodorum]KAH6516988.1 hypothetical protein HBI07_247670 [Parastagonospora nodorum]